MATSVMQRQKTGSWSAIFPTEQVTQQQSALFVKKLLAVAISNITYLRTIFPEHAFGDRCLEDLNLKILRDDSACPGACQVIQWVKGCFDALDRQYTAVETYTFKFDYSDNKGVTIFRNDTEVVSAFTETETKRATIKLLRTIIVLTQTLQPLPDDVMMTMKLCYYDDVTPEEYEPPGFQPTNSEDFVFEDNPVSIRVGDVGTPFHALACNEEGTDQVRISCYDPVLQHFLEDDKLRIKTKRSQFSGADALTEELDSKSTADYGCGVKVVGVTLNKGVVDKGVAVGGGGVCDTDTADVGQAIGTAHEPDQEEDSVKEGEGDPEEEEIKREGGEDGEKCQATSSLPTGGKGTASHAAEDNTVICPCGVNEDDGLMVLCGVCKVWQHAICYCLLEEKHVPDFHVCVTCAKNDCGNACTDPTLISLSHTFLKSTCLWRRTLHACLDLSRVLPSGLARRLGVSVPMAQGILERLEHEGFVRPPGKKRVGRQVVKVKLLAEGVPKYLSLPPKANNSTKNNSKKQPTAMANTGPTFSTRPLKPVNGMKSLTDKASHLDISSIASREPEKENVTSTWKRPHKALIMSRQREIDTCEVRRSPRIMAKRVRSVVDETQEFEVSCSQEQQDGGVVESGGVRSSKRRKLSIASHPIMV